MKSMTGYGVSRFSSKDLSIDVMVRSVNGRFLEIRFRLPDEYLIFEPDLRKIVVEKVSRGSLDIRVCRRELVKPEGADQWIISSQLAKGWLDACQNLSEELGIKRGEVTVQSLLNSVEVIRHERDDEISVGQREKDFLLREVSQAVSACCEEREREGLALKKELLENLKGLQHFVQSAEKLSKEANERLAERFHQRLIRLGLSSSLDPQRWGEEVALQLEKSDINEELVRLGEHVRGFEEILDRKGGVFGRKLDFYAQELLREVNTIGSKSHLSQLTQLVVDAKIIIERIREQVQNIE